MSANSDHHQPIQLAHDENQVALKARMLVRTQDMQVGHGAEQTDDGLWGAGTAAWRAQVRRRAGEWVSGSLWWGVCKGLWAASGGPKGGTTNMGARALRCANPQPPDALLRPAATPTPLGAQVGW